MLVARTSQGGSAITFNEANEMPALAFEIGAKSPPALAKLWP
jgi:hypothetical protein